jgi:biopolymer transport protein ExbB
MTEMLANIGLLLYPLLAMSLMGMTLIVERSLYYARLPALDNCAETKRLHTLLEKNSNLSKPLRDELVSQQLLILREGYERGLKLLRLVAVVSPMLGLLGTVLGMIDAFRVIAADTGPVAPAMIADGLWSAMLTTAYGLIIAVPCLFAAFIFSRISEKRLSRLQTRLNEASLKMEGAIYA